MQISTYDDDRQTRANTYNFYGLNRTRRGRRGEFEDMKNMSANEYPCAAPRGRRKKLIEQPQIRVVCAPDETNTEHITGFTGIAGDAFFYDGVNKSGKHIITPGKWTVRRLGNMYIIGATTSGNPAIYYYNVDTDKFDYISETVDNLTVTTGYDNEKGYYIESFRCDYQAVKKYLIDNGYSECAAKIASVCVRKNNIFQEVFSIGEQIEIRGFPSENDNKGQVFSYSAGAETVTVRVGDFSQNNLVHTDALSNINEITASAITGMYVKSFETISVSISGNKYYKHRMYIDLINKNGDNARFSDMSTADGANMFCVGIIISKYKPCFDNMGIHHNRIWCTAPSGNVIYASSADNYSFTADDITKGFAARLPSDTEGHFTGIAEYGNEMVLFKRTSITVVYGDNASNYRTSIIHGIGCIDGSSITQTPSGIIFLGYKGFYQYSGSIPKLMSSKLNTIYTHAVSGFDGNTYYAAAERFDGAKELLAYDMRCGTWHIHDKLSEPNAAKDGLTNVTGMFRFLGNFYICDDSGIYQTDSDDSDEDFEWSFTSIISHDDTLNNKQVNHLWVRVDKEENAHFLIETKCDDNDWEIHNEYGGKGGMRVYHNSIRQQMGHTYRYRISGHGKIVFYEIEIKKADGGRRYKDADQTSQQSTRIFAGNESIERY